MDQIYVADDMDRGLAVVNAAGNLRVFMCRELLDWVRTSCFSARTLLHGAC